jgi:transcriptional regulator with XRE-family HTH domain
MTRAATDIPHGTPTGRKYHGCPCLDCYEAAAAYENTRYKRIGYGTWRPFVDAAPARAHIEALHAQGMTWELIAKQAGMYVEELRRLRMPLGSKPRTERIRPEREALLLSLRFAVEPPAPKACVPSVGTARRLQALRAIGWPVRELAARSGVSRQAVSAALRQDLVQAATHARIVELYDDLHDQDPRRWGIDVVAVDRAVRAARRRKWLAPNSWLGVDMDDPAAASVTRTGLRYATPNLGDRQAAVLENTAELARLGCTREEIATRLGITWNAVHRHHLRAGRPLPASLVMDGGAS